MIFNNLNCKFKKRVINNIKLCFYFIVKKEKHLKKGNNLQRPLQMQIIFVEKLLVIIFFF